MRRKGKFTPETWSNVFVHDIAEDGRGIARHEDKVVFVDKGVPGDVVSLLVFNKKKSLFEAKITQIDQPSALRQVAFCSHFGVCGGCKWQHMTYAGQLEFKQKQIKDSLERIGGLTTETLQNILPSPKTEYYRNKLEFTFSNKKWFTDATNLSENPNALGFHVPGRFDKIIEIEHCYLQENPSNQIRNAIREYAVNHALTFYDLKQHTGFLRNVIIRTASTKETMVILVVAEDNQTEITGIMQFIAEKFPEITSLLYIINTKKNDTIFDQEIIVYTGRDYILEEMPLLDKETETIQFKIGPKSFYQTNSEQAFYLYKTALEFAGLTGTELVYDLYTGAGTIANFIAHKAKKVIGIEYVPSAIEDAKENANLNSISNTEFFAGDMKDILNEEFLTTHGKPDVIITDPPRAGMHPDVVARIAAIEAERIVYVSCNAATQARDLLVLKEKYQVEKIQPVDMFPHTQHVENVVLLRLKK